MIYIISGASRSGKTLIAKKMMVEYNIPYLSLDSLVMGFTNGIPEYGIHDKLWPHEIAERLWPFLKAMLQNMLWSDIDYILEGEAVLPRHIAELSKEHPDEMRVCYLGFSDVKLEEKVEDIYKYSRGKKDWLTNESRAYVEDHINNMIVYSQRVEKECIKYKIKYINTSNSFIPALDSAIDYLMEQGN